jgi:hypothetical protein
VPHSPRYLKTITDYISIPNFPDLLAKFLHEQAHPQDTPANQAVHISQYRSYHGKIHIFHSATCIYSAQSDSTSSISGAVHQVIHCVPSWNHGPPRYDCVFVNNDPDLPGFEGLYVGQVLLLFSIKSQVHSRRDKDIPCALVQWFEVVGDKPCNLTGMWMVKPELDPRTKQRVMSVIHVGSIVRPAHLIPLYGKEHVHHDLCAADSINSYKGFYVNKFSDYHAYRLAF